MDSVIADVRTIVGGAFALQPEAFRAAVLLPGGWYFAAAVILWRDSRTRSVRAWCSSRTRCGRHVSYSALLVNARCSSPPAYLFLVVSTWAIMQLPGQPHVAFGDLAIVLALAYLPYWLAFLVALPYLGYGINWLLRALHLVALVVAVAAIAGNGVFGALACVGIGWLVVVIAQQTVGKPVALLGEKILNAVAGVQVTANEQLAIDRLDPADLRPAIDGTAQQPAAALRVPRAPAHSGVWKVALALAAMLALGYVCALALAPMHDVLFGWQARLPAAVQLPLNLLWIGVIGILVAGFMAPLETLGWWAGWYGDRLDTSAPSTDASAPAGDTAVSRYVVYLDGISQSGARYLPDVEAFLDALVPRLPEGTRLVRGVMTYSVINRPLDEDPIFSWFWSVDRQGALGQRGRACLECSSTCAMSDRSGLRRHALRADLQLRYCAARLRRPDRERLPAAQRHAGHVHRLQRRRANGRRERRQGQSRPRSAGRRDLARRRHQR